jgi:transcriptional regulator with XRE-family HTH domain
LVERIQRLRRERWTGVRIAQATGLSRATVSRILTRLKLNKIRMLEPAPVYPRYEHAAPGDLLHLDIKKLARIVKAGHRITGNPQDETRGAGCPMRPQPLPQPSCTWPATTSSASPSMSAAC